MGWGWGSLNYKAEKTSFQTSVRIWVFTVSPTTSMPLLTVPESACISESGVLIQESTNFIIQLMFNNIPMFFSKFCFTVVSLPG